MKKYLKRQKDSWCEISKVVITDEGIGRLDESSYFQFIDDLILMKIWIYYAIRS